MTDLRDLMRLDFVNDYEVLTERWSDEEHKVFSTIVTKGGRQVLQRFYSNFDDSEVGHVEVTAIIKDVSEMI